MKIILLLLFFWIIKLFYKSITLKNNQNSKNNIIDAEFEEVDEGN